MCTYTKRTKNIFASPVLKKQKCRLLVLFSFTIYKKFNFLCEISSKNNTNIKNLKFINNKIFNKTMYMTRGLKYTTFFNLTVSKQCKIGVISHICM